MVLVPAEDHQILGQTAEDLAQASITLSNLGGFGVDRFNALLFPPQPVIVSAGSIRMRPIATGDGALKAALTCEIGLTVDHRRPVVTIYRNNPRYCPPEMLKADICLPILPPGTTAHPAGDQAA